MSSGARQRGFAGRRATVIGAGYLEALLAGFMDILDHAWLIGKMVWEADCQCRFGSFTSMLSCPLPCPLSTIADNPRPNETVCLSYLCVPSAKDWYNCDGPSPGLACSESARQPLAEWQSISLPHTRILLNICKAEKSGPPTADRQDKGARCGAVGRETFKRLITTFLAWTHPAGV
jgi:hypothetical protein